MNASAKAGLAIAAVMASCAIYASRAAAQVDPWEFEVYPYATEGRGVLEVEALNSVIANGHSTGFNGTSAGAFASQAMYRSAIELTYGLTDRIEAAAYLTTAQVSGHGFWYSGSKYRLRGRLFDEETLPLELGWYAELEWHHTPQFDDADLELELRPIIEKDYGALALIVNPIFEKSLAGAGRRQGFEFGYVSGAYYRSLRAISPGLEFYGGVGLIDDNAPLHNQQHYIFPVVWGELPHGLEYNVGPGIGLTRGSDHVIMKFNFELEHFIGALFGPSAESNWFF
ncbi:MAG TPA: hypothetical protein VKS22_08550 [Candidatus Binataceae bacterium]|nr:hypothetical protein [Candidatus Binataceae bacterium]